MICDTSSDIGAWKIPWERYGVIYVDTQTYLKVEGICIGIIKEDLFGHARPDTPSLCDWNNAYK